MKTQKIKRTPEYVTWYAMKGRCLNPKNNRFKNYSGRGITICDRWKSSFDNFLKDMGQRPPGHSIERIDNNGNYEPSNCRWATSKEQSNNRKSNLMLTIDGKTQTVTQWAQHFGVRPQTAICRIRAGWDRFQAVTIFPRPIKLNPNRKTRKKI